ncbi:MAG TPA: hypothetical protein VK903_04085 [Propionicimonas sp.]|nr:hypothetical protein [Propionicimonas sp.]
MRRPLLAAVLMAIFAIGSLAAATTTQALPLPQAATCAGVWVVVDYGSEGGISTRCATKHGTGTAALRSAGFNPTLDGGMITRISGKPASVDVNKNYWSYWHATRKSDGSYSGWSYSSQGANSYHPSAGSADGWRYQALSDGKVAPGAAPPKAQTTAPKPTPTKPKATPTAKATAKPTPTRTTATGKATATPRATPTATPAATPTGPVETAAEATGEPVESTTFEQAGGASPGGGSPVGAIAAGAVVILGGAGLGGWWLLKGRKP